MKTLTFRVNAYFAILLVTIVGAGASMLIIRVADSVDSNFVSEAYSDIEDHPYYNQKLH